MFKKYGTKVALIALLMVTILSTGCIGPFKTYKLTVNIEPKEAAVAEGIAKSYKKDSVATFTLKVNEGYEFVKWEGTAPVEKDGKFEIPIEKSDVKLKAIFKKIDEEPVDPKEELAEAIAIAEAALKALPETYTLADLVLVTETQAKVDAVYALDADAKIEGVDKLEKAWEAMDKLGAAEHTIGKDQVKTLVVGVNEKDTFTGDKFTLNQELKVGVSTFTVIWSADESGIIEIDGKDAKVKNRPEVDTDVTLTATIGYQGMAAQAAQTFEFKIKVEGWVANAVKAANTTELKKALDGLKVEYFEANLGDYLARIKALVEVKTKADIEKAIAFVDAGPVADFNKAVEEYFKAETTQERNDALADAKTKAGVSRWQDDQGKLYVEAVPNGVKSVPELQGIVDGINLTQLEKLVVAAEKEVQTIAKYDAANDLFEDIYEGLTKAQKAEYNIRLKKVKWMNEVINADAGAVIGALAELKIGEESIIKIENVKNHPVVAAAYSAAFQDTKTGLKGLVTPDQIQLKVNEVNGKQLEAALNALVQADADADVLAELGLIEAITKSETLKWNIVAGNSAAYKTAIKDEKLTKPSYQEIHALVEAVNAVEAEKALVVKINALDGSTIQAFIEEELKIESFKNLTATQREEVAKVLVPDPVKPYKKSQDFVAAVKAEVVNYQTLLGAVNSASSNTATQLALQAAVKSEYLNVDPTLANAENVLNAKPKEGYASFAEVDAKY